MASGNTLNEASVEASMTVSVGNTTNEASAAAGETTKEASTEEEISEGTSTNELTREERMERRKVASIKKKLKALGQVMPHIGTVKC